MNIQAVEFGVAGGRYCGPKRDLRACKRVFVVLCVHVSGCGEKRGFDGVAQTIADKRVQFEVLYEIVDYEKAAILVGLACPFGFVPVQLLVGWSGIGVTFVD